MSVHHFIDPRHRLIVVYVRANATREQVLRDNDQIDQHEGAESFNSLTIFENLNRVVGDIEGENSLRAISEQLSTRYGTGGTFRSAFVVTKEVDYGLLRMYIAYRGRDSKYSELFYDTEEALAWLDIDASEVDGVLDEIARLKLAAAG